MKINFINLIKSNKEQGYIKNTSPLVTALLILSGIVYKPMHGYLSIGILIIALIIMIFKKTLLNQANNYFSDMYRAKEMYEKTKNDKYLEFISLSIEKILKDVNVYSEKAKIEIRIFQNFLNENQLVK